MCDIDTAKVIATVNDTITGKSYQAELKIKLIKVHLIIHGAGYNNTTTSRGSVGDGFLKSANALKKKIESSVTFDNSTEIVKVYYTSSSERFFEAINSQEMFSIISLTVFSHGYIFMKNAGISLGGERAGESRIDGSKATKEDEKKQFEDYDLREVNLKNYTNIDIDKFDEKAKIILYGCYLGGSPSLQKGYTDEAIIKYAFAPHLSNWLQLPIQAFTGSGLFKTKERTMNGTPIYDGTMIRAEDVNNQTVRLSIFSPNANPLIIR